MRKFAFVILDDSDMIIDRFNLDYVDGLSGLGFQIKLSTIETDIESYITKVVQQKQNLGLKVHHISGYKAGDYLKLWLSKHINDCLCIEYDNTQKLSYIEGKVIMCGETELNQFGVLEQSLTFQPLTPFFEKVENDVKIQVSSIGKSYPYKYPYCYGRNTIENNEISNTYIKDIPLIITLYGEMSNPSIRLLDENNNVYNEVRFKDVELAEGDKLIINAAQKKIFLEDSSGNKSDYYYKADGAYDSYLRASPGIKTKIDTSLNPNESGYLVGSRRQYRL